MKASAINTGSTRVGPAPTHCGGVGGLEAGAPAQLVHLAVSDAVAVAVAVASSSSLSFWMSLCALCDIILRQLREVVRLRLRHQQRRGGPVARFHPHVSRASPQGPGPATIVANGTSLGHAVMMRMRCDAIDMVMQMFSTEADSAHSDMIAVVGGLHTHTRARTHDAMHCNTR